MTLKVFISGAYSSTLEALAPAYEKLTGTKIVSEFGASTGQTPDAIPKRLARGETADVLILVGDDLDPLIAEGKAVPGSRVDLARAAIAAAVRAAVPKPDIRTAEGLKNALLAAHSIVYSESASGKYIKEELFEKLGIAAQVKEKAHVVIGKSVGKVVADGEADFGFQQLAELMPVDGIGLLGLLPAELQSITTISAGIAASSDQQPEAAAFIDFLASAAQDPTLREKGLEPAKQPPAK